MLRSGGGARSPSPPALNRSPGERACDAQRKSAAITAAVLYDTGLDRILPSTSMSQSAHTIAIDAALAGDWDRAHEIVQEMGDPLACWIHAILHKIEGDSGNSCYWYARSSGRRYSDFADPKAELEAVRAAAVDL